MNTKNQKKINFFFLLLHTVKKNLPWIDWLAFVVVSLSCVVLFVFIFVNNTNKETYIEIVTSTGNFLYPINNTESITFDGPVGSTQVTIKNGVVDVVRSPGRQQICVDATPISKAGQWLACLPNKIFIHIISNAADKKQSDDSITLDGVSF